MWRLTSFAVKNETFLTTHTGAKIHILYKNSHIQNHSIDKTRIFKISLLTKITFQKPIFHKKSYFQISFFTKITLFQTSNSSEFMDKKCDFDPVCHKPQNKTLTICPNSMRPSLVLIWDKSIFWRFVLLVSKSCFVPSGAASQLLSFADSSCCVSS